MDDHGPKHQSTLNEPIRGAENPSVIKRCTRDKHVNEFVKHEPDMLGKQRLKKQVCGGSSP